MYLSSQYIKTLPQHVAALLTHSTPNRRTSEVVADYERYLQSTYTLPFISYNMQHSK